LRGNGSHVFEYFATDVAGNDETTHSMTIRITGDVHVFPVSSLASSGTAGANGWYVSLVYGTLSATGGSGTSVAYRVDSAPWRTYASPFSITEGRHVFQFQASDGAGYLEPLRSTTIDIDYTPPTVVETTPNSGTMRPDDPLSWIASDQVSGLARYEVSIDGGPSQTMGLVTTLSRHWTEGAHVVVVKAFDGAGNQASSVISFDVAANAPPNPGSSPLPAAPQLSSSVMPVVLFLLLGGVAVWYGLRGGKGRSVRARRSRKARARQRASHPPVPREELVETSHPALEVVSIIPGR